MAATFLGSGSDIIIRTGYPSSPHHFHAHKMLLALASSVFESMFLLPQPPNQAHNGNAGIPIVDVTESQEAMDIFFRLLYPMVERPRIINSGLPTIVALFEVADKYDIPSLGSDLGGCFVGAFEP